MASPATPNLYRIVRNVRLMCPMDYLLAISIPRCCPLAILISALLMIESEHADRPTVVGTPDRGDC